MIEWRAQRRNYWRRSTALKAEFKRTGRPEPWNALILLHLPERGCDCPSMVCG